MQKYERDRVRRAHRQKLTNIKPGVDNGPPKTYPHLVVRLKRLQKDEERQSMVEHNNRLLLHKIGAIMTRNSQMDNWNQYETKSLNTGYRERLLEQIATENIGIGKRLGNVKPIYDIQKWEEDYKRHNDYLGRRSEETKDYSDTYRSPHTHHRTKTQSDMDRSETSDSRFPNIGNKSNDHTVSHNYHDNVKLPPLQQNKKNDGSSMAEFDAKQLFKVAKGLAPPDEIFIKSLARRTHKQRMQTSDKFQQMYDLEVSGELKQGLGVKWHILIDALMTAHETSDSAAIHRAHSEKQFGKIVELLVSREHSEKMRLNETYKQDYGSTLESELRDSTSGPLQTLLVKLLTEENEEVDREEVERDQQQMLNPQEWRFESSYTKICSVLENKCVAHVKATFSSVKPVSRSGEMLNTLRQDCDDDTFVDALSALVRRDSDTDDLYAATLYQHLSASDPVFVATLVERAEVDMTGVRKAYKKKYGGDLIEDLNDRGPHPTNKVLSDLIAAGSRTRSPKRHAGVAIQPQGRQKPLRQPPSKKLEKDEQTSPLSQRGRRPLAEVKHKQAEDKKDERDVESDCVRVHQALKGSGTDERVLIEVLVRRSNAERQKIRAQYHDKYHEELIDVLRDELAGDVEEIALALLQSPTEYDTHCLHAAMAGVGTDETVLLGVICTRSQQELSAVKDLYKKEHESSLEDDVCGDTSKGFRRMLMELVRGGREEKRVDKSLARDEADDLHESVKNGQMDMDLLQRVLTKHSRDQVSEFLRQYQQISGHKLKEDIRSCLSGDDEEGYIALVAALDDPVLFYAERLRGAFDGVGTNDSTVIRIIASRAEVDLTEIKSVYTELYGRRLQDDVEAECSGDYRNILLALIGP